MAKPPFSRRKKVPPFASEPLSDNSGLLVTLSDLTLLLLCCVVIWHVVDKQEVLRQYTLESSTTSSPSPALPPVSADPSLEFSAILPTFQQEETILTAAPIPQRKNVNRWEILKQEMETAVNESGLDDQVHILSTQEELYIALKEVVLFSRGKADLNNGIAPILEKVASLARRHPDLALEVLGHTDDVPITTAEFPSNWELSTARASRVARRLIEEGVIPSRISAQGYASFRPLVANTSEENRAVNRRVEIRLFRLGKDKHDANP